MAEDDLLRVSTRDGKYTVIQQATGDMRFERHGEDWLAANVSFVHVNLILALAQDLEAANKVAEAAETFLEHLLEEGLVSKEHLLEALKEWNQDRKKGK
jgi:uncharacterized protein YsxB (DUF464 family)